MRDAMMEDIQAMVDAAVAQRLKRLKKPAEKEESTSDEVELDEEMMAELESSLKE